MEGMLAQECPVQPVGVMLCLSLCVDSFPQTLPSGGAQKKKRGPQLRDSGRICCWESGTGVRMDGTLGPSP